MPTPPSLGRNFSWNLTGNVVHALAEWGAFLALARLAEPEVLGQYALALAVTSPVVLLANLQLRAVIATDARGEHRLGEYLALRIGTTAAALGLILVLSPVAASDARGAWLICVVGIAKAVEALSDLCYGLFQRCEEMELVARSLFLRSTSFVAFVAILLLGGDVVWAAASRALVWLAVLVLHDFPAGRGLWRQRQGEHFTPAWGRDRLEALVRRSLPLGLVMLLISLNVNLPRYFIAHHLGEGALGIFAAVASLVLAGNLIVDALGQAASPGLARTYAAGSVAAFRKALGRLLALGAAVGAAGLSVALVAGKPLLGLLFGAAYAGSASLLVWLLCAGAVGYLASLLGHGMTAAGKFREQVPLFTLVTAALGLACAWLVPRHGLSGAAWSILLSSLLTLAGASLVLARATRTAAR